MAAGGIKFTSFYSASSVCTPSRAALLTGRYPIRSGLVRVLFPAEEFGIPDSEVTVADLLRQHGYATGCIGKWHLGDLPRYHPRRHGFDRYYGLLYSNDMDPRHLPQIPWPYPPSVWRNEEKIETPAVQETLTERYTAEAVKFIADNRRKPFFLYLAHSMVHWPWHASARFRGKSRYGPFGDAVEEVDWSLGEVLKSLREHGLEENTLVIFTSDNGGGFIRAGGSSNGMLRGGKASMWEGGFREPFVARWPGKIPAGAVSAEMACTMDLFTTFLRLAGAPPQRDRPIDGVDVWAALSGGASPRSEFLFYGSNWDSQAPVRAIRSGPWKLHFREEFAPGELYQVEADPAESRDRAKDEPAVVRRLAERAREMASGIQPGRQCPPLPEPMRPKPGK